MDVSINAERFFQRLERLQTHWTTHKSTVWGGSDALCIPLGGASGKEMSYSKSSSMHLYLLGYEFPDSIIIITRNSFHFMATAKKCSYLEVAFKDTTSSVSVNFLKKEKDEGVNRENFHSLLAVIRKGGGKRLGSLFNGEYDGSFIPMWMEMVQQSQIEMFEIAAGLGLFFASKDEGELDLCKRAAVLTNKVMKHGFVTAMEDILDADKKMTHEKLATQIEAIIFDPSKIGVKVSSELVEICFTPIIQSGGKYDIKVSAQSNADILSSDIIICSLGARYKNYCANVSRTFIVDAPPKVEKTYATLIGLYDACLDQMVPGHELKDVIEAARAFLTKKDASLLSFLPKTLGFAVGLEFRDNTLLLNSSNSTQFSDGMLFTLSVGLHNVPLAPEDVAKASPAYQKLTAFSLLLADTVRINAEGVPEILTKIAKDFVSVSYNINDKGNDKDGDDDDVIDVDAMDDEDKGMRRSGRQKDERAAVESAASKRAARQIELMKKKLAAARRRIENGDGAKEGEEEVEEQDVADIKTYKSVEDYPRDVLPTQLKVDMEKEALLLPINGRSVPFHISTIKNISMPEQDRATWMRINFFIPGVALGKDVAKNVQQLVLKHGDRAVFVKELTFRSLDSRNLTQVNMLYQELRKRIKLRDQKAEQEKNLVVQTKLIRIKDQRVPRCLLSIGALTTHGIAFILRNISCHITMQYSSNTYLIRLPLLRRLQDLTMRPQMSGRKCVGSLEAHQNGLRFISNKGEILDIMYGNVKHALYQPCDKTTMVLVHFHLKEFIMIGKKKQKDVQFFSEVVDSSTNLEGSKRYSYDPDELDDEQREREMRKRLNLAFKDFCQKVEKVAAHYDINLMIDVPFKKSGFEGNPNKEMVLLQPTTHCLINVTESPFFVITLSEIDHAHFERVSYATKNFDLTLVFKDFSILPRTIAAIDVKAMDTIQDWLNLVEITYTVGPMSLNWNMLMAQVREQGDNFYLDEDEEGEKKPEGAGWQFLSLEEEEAGSDGDDNDGDSSFGGGSGEDSEDEDDSSDSDGEDDSDFDSEEDGSDFDEDEEDELEEKGQSWEDIEREAGASDRAKRTFEDEPPSNANKKMKRR